jgi:hypothetical protein
MVHKNITYDLPIPTTRQCSNYSVHITNAHSWYKHIPLLTGATFIVFPDKNAGMNYPLLHPKIASGNSREGYIKEFGFLNYVYKTELNGVWNMDANIDNEYIETLINELPKFIKDHCSFQLYPVVSDEFEEAYSVHKEDIKKVKSNFHPYADLLLKWEENHISKEKCWEGLTCDERDMVLLADSDANLNSTHTENVIKYISFEKSEYALLSKMRVLERQKITNSIEKLKAFMEGLV